MQERNRGQSKRQRRKQYYDILELLKQKKIPEAYPEAEEGHQLGEESMEFRAQLLDCCGYCLIAYDWIRPLAEWIGKRRCLEIMCGSGALSSALQRCGVNIIATDDYSWEQKHTVSWFRDTWTKVEQFSAVNAIRTYGEQVDFVLCSWPFLSEDCYDALQMMRKVNTDARMIFIGEWQGATASDAFFRAAQVIPSESFQYAISKFKSIYSTRDYPYLIK